jgi:hypothetical protein
MKVIAFDPGEKVGWATGTVDRAGHLKVTGWGITPLKTMALTWMNRAMDYDVMIYERFRIGGQDDLKNFIGSDVPTLQLVGMLRLGAWQAQIHRGDGLPQIIDQTSNNKQKGLGAARLYDPETFEVIREALDGPHDQGHHGDALMHLYAWWAEHIAKPKGWVV